MGGSFGFSFIYGGYIWSKIIFCRYRFGDLFCSVVLIYVIECSSRVGVVYIVICFIIYLFVYLSIYCVNICDFLVGCYRYNRMYGRYVYVYVYSWVFVFR